jgi:hypothetical protein
MTTKSLCEQLHKLNADAVAAFAEAKRVRRQRDLSFYEDAELSREGHRRIDALVKHLLVGHDGEPCPDGDRPIISIATSAGMKTSREKSKRPNGVTSNFRRSSAHDLESRTTR